MDLILGAAAVVALGFLLLPVAIGFVGSHPGGGGPFEVCARLAPWWGLLGLQLRRREPQWELAPLVAGCALRPRLHLGRGRPEAVPPSEERRPEPPAPVRPAPLERPRPARPGRRFPVSLVRPLVRPALRLVRGCPGALALRRLRLDGTVGMSDPAATGQVCGLLFALGGATPRRLEVRITPDFTAAGARGRVEVRAHLYLVKLLWVLGVFMGTAGWGLVRARLSAWRAARRA